LKVLDILCFALIGVLLGAITGLTPGLHVNTLVVIILSLTPFFPESLGIEGVVALIIAMSITHTFVSFIPAIFIGAPREDNVLSVLPGHRLLIQGRGYEAVRLTLLGGIGAIAVSVAVLPLGLKVLPILYEATRAVLPYLLLGVLGFMVFTEDGWRRKTFSLVLILYSGALGLLVLNKGLLPAKFALFPTLTGLFGLSTLLISLRSRVEIPEQTLEYDSGNYPRGLLAGSLGGILTGLLPSIGSSQSALIIQNFLGEKKEKSFLVALGGVNTSDAIYALFALYLIGNPRSGASIAVERLLPEVIYADFLFMVGVVLFTSFFAALITLNLAKFFVRKIQKLDYGKFSLGVLLFLTVLILLLTGPVGLLIAGTGTAIGVAAPLAGIKRSHGMAVLIIPTILYFLGV
jgi:putative membrane protein